MEDGGSPTIQTNSGWNLPDFHKNLSASEHFLVPLLGLPEFPQRTSRAYYPGSCLMWYVVSSSSHIFHMLTGIYQTMYCLHDLVGAQRILPSPYDTRRTFSNYTRYYTSHGSHPCYYRYRIAYRLTKSAHFSLRSPHISPSENCSF